MGLNKTQRNFCEGERQMADDLRGKSGELAIQVSTGCFPKKGLAGKRRKRTSHVVKGPHWSVFSLQPDPSLWPNSSSSPSPRLSVGAPGSGLRPQTSSLLCLTPFPVSSILHACTDCRLLVMTSLDPVQTSRNIHLLAPHFCSETGFQTIDFFYPKPAPLTALSVSMNRHSSLPVPCVKLLGSIFDSVLYLTAGISPVSGSRQLLLGPNVATSGGSRCHL